jgi:hypothetical protein
MRLPDVQIFRRLIGGTCIVCDNIPTTLVTYDVSDVDGKGQRIERYCDRCYSKLVLVSNGRDQILAEKVEENYTNSA